MWRKLFRKQGRFSEVSTPSGEKRVLSHEEYVSRSIADRRVEAELFRLGISARRDPRHLVEYVIHRSLH
jgi:hypothetical protein